MLTFTCLKIEGCLPVWCQLKLVPLGVKIVLIIKQLDSYNMHCWVGVLCTLHFANIYYLTKLIMQQLWARLKMMLLVTASPWLECVYPDNCSAFFVLASQMVNLD